MGLTGSRTYVGFGFGAIQAGLFLYEAYRSGNFGRLVVAEVVPEVVAGLRRAGGAYAVNVAHADRVEPVGIGPVEIYNPALSSDRHRLTEALVEAHEIATAIPSVSGYRSSGPGSLHRVLAQGLGLKAARGGPAAVVYAAENHNHAAELLEAAVQGELQPAEQGAVHARVQFLNTVIGKMSGVISDPDAIRHHDLATVTPGDPRAFLVEAFNRILISRVEARDCFALPPGGCADDRPGPGEPPAESGGETPLAAGATCSFRRGIEVFEEKADLLPFEEAKLYGHNATHALGAYLGALAGVPRIADLSSLPGVLAFLRAAFLDESGEALVRRHACADPLFTREGYAQYADDLLVRMTNPFLLDTVERVGRDPARKLGWNDRLVGTMRLALQQGIEPRRYAFGAAAALAAMDRSMLEHPQQAGTRLGPVWQEAAPEPEERGQVLGLIEVGLYQVGAWHDSGFGDPERALGRATGQQEGIGRVPDV